MPLPQPPPTQRISPTRAAANEGQLLQTEGQESSEEYASRNSRTFQERGASSMVEPIRVRNARDTTFDKNSQSESSDPSNIISPFVLMINNIAGYITMEKIKHICTLRNMKPGEAEKLKCGLDLLLKLHEESLFDETNLNGLEVLLHTAGLVWATKEIKKYQRQRGVLDQEWSFNSSGKKIESELRTDFSSSKGHTEDPYISVRVWEEYKSNTDILKMPDEMGKTTYETIKKMYTLEVSPKLETFSFSDKIRAMLVGKTGTGKSTTANTISWKDLFKEEEDWSASATNKSKKGAYKVNCRLIQVTDTPRSHETLRSKVDITWKTARVVQVFAKEIHSFIYVQDKSKPRFTQENKEIIELIKDMFGGGIITLRPTFFVYNKADTLSTSSLDIFCDEQMGDDSQAMYHLLKNLDWSFFAVNNKTTISADKRNQEVIIAMVDMLGEQSDNAVYTNKMFEKAVEKIKELDKKGEKMGWNPVVMAAADAVIAADPDVGKDTKVFSESIQNTLEGNEEEIERELKEARRRREKEEKLSIAEQKERERVLKEEIEQDEKRERIQWQKRQEEQERRYREELIRMTREWTRREQEWIQRQKQQDLKWQQALEREREERRKREQDGESKREAKARQEREMMEQELEKLNEKERKQRQKREEGETARRERLKGELKEAKRTEKERQDKIVRMQAARLAERKQRLQHTEREKQEMEGRERQRIELIEDEWNEKLESEMEEVRLRTERQEELLGEEIKRAREAREIAREHNGVFNSMTQASTDNVDEKQSHRLEEEGQELSSLLATSLISNLGVSLVIGDTGVELHIPANAFHEKEQEKQIQMSIIPSGASDESPQCFEDNTTTVVEIVPNMLQLRQTATLILPHCLVLGDPNDCEVKIFQSHHDEGQQPLWEDISESAQPKLHEKYCEFQLREFCWLKYTIQGQSVMGKRLLLYTLGENYTKQHVTATVGYIPALPGAQEIIKDEFNEVTKGTVYKSNLQGRIIGCWQSFIFRKEPAKPLKISIEEVVPNDGWQSGKKQHKTISYSDIELSNEQSRSFTFDRIKSEAPFPVCRFEISQVEETEIHIDLAQRSHDEPIEPPLVQTENTQPRGHERRESGALRPMSEARQVQNTEMVLSPTGEVAIRGQRHEEIILHPDMSPNAVQDLSNRLQACVPSQRNPLQLQLPRPNEHLPIFSQLSPSDISKLSSCLDPDHPLHKDWKMLAERLGFTSANLWNFQRNGSPTEAVIFCACQSGKLCSKLQLMQILQDMGRLDARLAISD